MNLKIKVWLYLKTEGVHIKDFMLKFKRKKTVCLANASMRYIRTNMLNRINTL